MSRFRVEVRVVLQRVEPDGRWTNDRMSFEDTADLGELDFAQISDLLGMFHEITQGAVEIVAPKPESESGG